MYCDVSVNEEGVCEKREGTALTLRRRELSRLSPRIHLPLSLPSRLDTCRLGTPQTDARHPYRPKAPLVAVWDQIAFQIS